MSYIKPNGKRVFVKILEAKDTKLKSGIILPKEDDAFTFRGEVMSVGADSCFEIGDKIISSVHTGTKIFYKGEEHIFLDDDGVLGYFND